MHKVAYLRSGNCLLFSGSVVLKSKFGDITEEIPKSYTLTDGREKEIQIKFCKLTDEIYGFLTSSTTPDHSSVIIDPLPNRLWATYYGGLDYDVGNDCKVDPMDLFILQEKHHPLTISQPPGFSD